MIKRKIRIKKAQLYIVNNSKFNKNPRKFFFNGNIINLKF